MIAKVNLTNDLIVKQKEELDLKRKIVNENYIKIDDVKANNQMLKESSNARERNLTESKELQESNTYYKYGAIGINILIFIVIISLLIFLYSS